MSFYPQFPPIYAYPMPMPTQDFYMYPSNPAVMGDGSIYYDQPGAINPMMMNPSQQLHHNPRTMKQGYNNRKDSVDSGISDFSSVSSRKTSTMSSISAHGSILEEEPSSSQKAEAETPAKEEPPMEEPADDLCEEIVTQVEFYFSDANITKDKFLLKHVKRNKEGFVSLKLISSFKRVKHLTKDWRQVAFAIEKVSKKLEVNDLKTKVRRLDPLPEYDETTPSRTVVALNLPLESPNIEAIAEIFSPCGDIVLIRILRPGNPVPADIKPFANKHPDMLAKVCAIVEFEKTEFAHKAVKDLSEEDEEKMTVMELTAVPLKVKNKDSAPAQRKLPVKPLTAHQQGGLFQQGGAVPQRRFSHAGFHLPPQHANPDQMVLGPRRRISLMHNMKFSPISEEDQKQKEQQFALNPNAPTFQMQQQQHHGGNMRRLSRPSFIHPGAAAMEMQMQMHAAAAAAAMGQAPWMFRRFHHADFAASGLTVPPNVARMPRGPDKSKGFQKWCKNRMETSSVPSSSVPVVRKPERSHAVPIVAPPKEEEEKPQNVGNDQAEAAVVEDEVVPDGAAALPVAAVAAAAAAVPEVAGADDGAVVTGDSDSGHEDGGLSEHEIDLGENERSR